MATVLRRVPKVSSSSVFYCRSKKRKLTMGECVDKYVESNAFDKRRSTCWRCFQGRKNRTDYAL